MPEIGEEGLTGDLSVKADSLPAFNEITIENCLGAIGRQAGAVEKTVKRLEKEIAEQLNSKSSDKESKFEVGQIFRELDEVSGPLDTTWGIAKALYLGNSTLIPTKTYMNVHERARNARAAKFCSRTLYELMKRASEDDKSYATRNAEESRLVQKYLLEGKLNGLGLKEKDREILRDILLKLVKERTNFKNKVNVATHSFAHVIRNYSLVRDFPEDVLRSTIIEPNNPITQGPWRFTLQPQTVETFLRFCPDRTHRWNIWQANVRKASTHVERSLENSTHIEEIRSLRTRQANILGYENFAEMSMQTKMVKNVSSLKKIFSRILKFAGPAQHREINDLQEFATKSGFDHQLDIFDVSYWQRKYLLSEHQLDEEALRVYFPLPRVFSGLFSLSEKLFDIRIVERKEASVWQPTVKYYDVFDGNSSSKAIGGFYVDCYAKETKFGNNGWMVSIRNRNDSANLSPLCAIIFNFYPPYSNLTTSANSSDTNEKDRDRPIPYLLDVDDIRIVFKTFGSALQHILTKATFTDIAGLSNVEWDASQIAGNVIANFLDHKDILKSISGHYETDEPISDELANKIPLLKTHLSGYKLCQELYLADLDIELHQSKAYWLEIVRKLWPIYQCMPLDKKDSHPCSMTEIFSGDWAAAQFSHLYSKMIAADITAAFNQDPSNMCAVGKRFRETFLSAGGSIPSGEVFRRFCGRDSSPEALLRSLNILNETQTTGEL